MFAQSLTEQSSLPDLASIMTGCAVKEHVSSSPEVYPVVGTCFPNLAIFTVQFKMPFAHMRNADFVGFNNTSSAIYLCPNYKHCGGILHGTFNKQVLTDADGKAMKDHNGYYKITQHPPFTIGDLTRACHCGPRRYTSISHPFLFSSLQGTTNVARGEFTHLASAYFKRPGCNIHETIDHGNRITWKCLACQRGCLVFHRNAKCKSDRKAYLSYGTITSARPCPSNCGSHTAHPSPKFFWIPKTYITNSMAIEAGDIQRVRQQTKAWSKEARQIAVHLLRERRKERAKQRAIEHKTENGTRKQLKLQKRANGLRSIV